MIVKHLSACISKSDVKTIHPNLAPYRDIIDPRFGKLQDFFKYLNDWKVPVDSLDGYTPQEKNKMLLPVSRETSE